MIKPCLPPYPCPIIPRRLHLRWPDTSIFPGDGFVHFQVWHFLSQLSITPRCPRLDGTGQYQQGMSWLELFCFFEIHGGAIQKDDLSTRLSLRACIIKFRAAVSCIVETCMIHEDAILFRPAKCATVRLKPLGFTNFVPCINSIVVPSRIEMDKMLLALVQLKLHLTKDRRRRLLQGQLEVVPGRLSLRGAPGWRQGMVVFKSLPSIEAQNQKPVCCSLVTPCTDGFCLSCPSCGVQKPVSNMTLYAHGRWARLKCATCYATCTARNWRCVCDAAWFTCAIHAHVGFACRSRVRKFVLKQKWQTSNSFDTNHIPPPSVDDGATLQPAAKKPTLKVRGHSAVEVQSSSTSSGGGAPAMPQSAATVSVRKRVLSAQPPKKRAKAKAKPFCRSSDTRAAVERMREARGNPI
jgi:hypothetical protein